MSKRRTSQGRTLSAAEQQRLDEQKAGLPPRIERMQRQLLQDVEDGRYFVMIDDDGLWRDDPLHKCRGVSRYICQVTGYKNRSSIEARMRVARHYPDPAQIEAFSRAGVCISTLSEITYAPAGLRAELEKMALVEGASSDDIRAAKKAARALLTRRKVLQSDVVAAMYKALAAQGRERVRELQRGERDPRHNGERGAAVEEAARAFHQRELKLAQRIEELEGQVRAQAGASEAQRALLEGELQRHRERLEEEREAKERFLQEERHKLEEQQRRLLQQPSPFCLASLVAVSQGVTRQVQEAQAESAAAQAEVAAARDAAQAVQQERAGLETEREALDKEREGLEKERAALEAAREEQDQLCRALEARQNQLDARQDELDRQEQELVARRAELAEYDKEFRQRAFEYEQRLVANNPLGLYRWPDDPYCINSTLLCITQYLNHVATLADRAVEECEEEGELPTDGGPGLLVDAARALTECRETVSDAIQRIIDKYLDEHPDDFARYLKENPEAFGKKAAPAAAAAPGAAAPPQDPAAKPVRVLLGSASRQSPQRGTLGLTPDLRQKVDLCLNSVGAINIVGLPENGKSSTMLNIVEMMQAEIPSISQTPVPLGLLHVHFPGGKGYPSGIHKCGRANSEKRSVDFLREHMGARPKGIDRRRWLVLARDEEELGRRRAEMPGEQVDAVRFDMRKVGIDAVCKLMMADDKAQLYLSDLVELVMAMPEEEVSLEAIDALIEGPRFDEQQRRYLRIRMHAVRRYFGGSGPTVSEHFGPGVLVGLLLDNPWIKEEEMMAVLTIILDLFSQSRDASGQTYMKGIFLDEAHKYVKRSIVQRQVLAIMRQMRHLRTWVILATQDPKTLVREMHELCTVTIVHRLRSVEGLKYLAESNEGWNRIGIRELAGLKRGEAYILSSVASDPAYVEEPQRVVIRPTCAMPGGSTQTSVSEEETAAP